MKDFVVGIPWYSRESYAGVVEVMADRRHLPARFEEWLARAERNVKDYETQGLTIKRVQIDARIFLQWCKLLSFRPDAHARSVFAEQQARATDTE
jgi:hypothetical protein